MLSRSRTVPRVVGGLSARICFPDSRTSRACTLRGSGLYRKRMEAEGIMSLRSEARAGVRAP